VRKQEAIRLSGRTLCAFFDHYEIGHDGAVLVRPDGYVAWRSATGHSDGAPLIHAVEQILDRRS
jgi:putative polyketide hydroxylase